MPLWGADGNRFHDALSREISYRNAARTIRGGRFLHSAPVEMTGMGAGFFIICGEAATTTLGLKGRQT